MKFLKYFLLIVGLMAMASTSVARPYYNYNYDNNVEKVVLRLGGEQFRGQNKIFLKRRIKQQTDIRFQEMKLKEVILVAKSKRGHGKVGLIVGHEESYSEIIPGYPREFHNNDRRSYSRIYLENPAYSSKGRWQLKLRGNIKIKKIIVKMERKFHNPRKITLDYYGEKFRGQNTLFLKRKIKQKYPGMNLRNKDLKKVVLFAKSKHGRGQAKLVVGQESSYSETIGGYPEEFHGYGGYDRIVFENPSWDSHGRWQIKLRGNIKVEKVVIKFARQSSEFYIH